MPGSRGADAEQDGAQYDDKRARTINELARESSSSIPTMNGNHGVGREPEILDVYQEMDCDIVLLQNARCSGQFTFLNLDIIGSLLKR